MYVLGRFAGMVMDKGTLFGILAVMGDGMHQDREPGTFPRRYRDGRDSKHLGKPVKIDLHSPFFYDIHHIQSKHHWFIKFYEL